MDKTTRLIKWQRITIVALLFALSAVAFSAVWFRFYSRLHEQNAAALETANQANAAHHTLDQMLIRDLDTRLTRYEKRFGEIDPQRKGEGVYLNGRHRPEDPMQP